jgi:DNA/RNA-binding protein KIN17
MKIFRENAGGMMDSFSKEFETGYMETLRRRHGTQRMNANNVYQEVIQDKHHVHMNSTKWASLSDFVQYVGKKGLCVVEETERGWYVTYIERDPALLARKEALKKKTEADQREERLAAKQRETLRMEAAKALDRAGCAVERKASEIGEREGDVKMEMKLGAKLGGKKKKKGKGQLSLLEEDDDDEEEEGGVNEEDAKIANGTGSNLAKLNGDSHHDKQQPKASYNRDSKQAPKRSLEQTAETKTKEAKKQKSSDDKNLDKRKDYWLYRDIVVRIISKKLAKGEYYKRKAIVDKVIGKYEAEVEVLESSRKARDGGDILRIDQDDLETVIPKDLGEKVRIVNGRHRGKKARVEKLDKEKYRAELRLVEDDRIVVLDYEDFSKMA